MYLNYLGQELDSEERDCSAAWQRPVSPGSSLPRDFGHPNHWFTTGEQQAVWSVSYKHILPTVCFTTDLCHEITSSFSFSCRNWNHTGAVGASTASVDAQQHHDMKNTGHLTTLKLLLFISNRHVGWGFCRVPAGSWAPGALGLWSQVGTIQSKHSLCFTWWSTMLLLKGCCCFCC